MTRPLLLALLLAGCASYPSDMSYSWDVDACLLRAQAIAEGAPRLVTYSELARVCRGEAP